MKRLAFALSFACITLVASAQVSSYGLVHDQFNVQTGTTSTVNTGYDTVARVSVTLTNSVGSSTAVTGGRRDIHPTGPTPGTWTDTSPLYADYASMLGDYPFGTYTFNLTQPGLPVDSGIVVDTRPMFTKDAPRFTNFDALQTIDPTLDFELDLSPLSMDPSAISASRHIEIYADGALDFAADLAPTATSVIVTGNGRLRKRPELLYQEWDNVISDSRLGFSSGGTGTVTYRTQTSFWVAGAPEPGTYVAVGLGLLGLARRRRRSP